MQQIRTYRFLFLILLFLTSSHPCFPSYPVQHDTLAPKTIKLKEDPPKKNKLAVWSFVLAVSGFLLLFLPYSSILSPYLIVGGLVTSIFALDQIKRKKQKGKGLAIAALIIGGISIIAIITAIIVLLSIFI